MLHDIYLCLSNEPSSLHPIQANWALHYLRKLVCIQGVQRSNVITDGREVLNVRSAKCQFVVYSFGTDITVVSNCEITDIFGTKTVRLWNPFT